MQDVETRLLEEWKANLDLLKFYEQLKQQRFSHFLTIRTAFIATVALLAKEVMGVDTCVNHGSPSFDLAIGTCAVESDLMRANAARLSRLHRRIPASARVARP